MDERLWDVAEESAAGRIDLLRIKADVVRAGEQLPHQRACLLAPSQPGEDLRQPERAREEGALFAREPVVAAIAANQITRAQVGADPIDGAGETLALVLSAVAEDHGEQHARVHLIAVGGAHVGAPLLRPTALADEAADCRRLSLPLVGVRGGGEAPRGESAGPAER